MQNNRLLAQRQTRGWWLAGLAALAVGLCWLALGLFMRSQVAPPLPAAMQLTALDGGAVAQLTSPAFTYSPGWHVSATGADPHEPANPFDEPAGIITFTYAGSELALQLATGDYWAYLVATVDGQPANLLPALTRPFDGQGPLAGYKTLHAPESVQDGQPTVRWLPIHRAATPGPHTVRLEFWRGWQQTPLRAVGVDVLPAPPLPWWPGILWVATGAWLLVYAFAAGNRQRSPALSASPPEPARWRLALAQSATPLAGTGVLLTVAGAGLEQWVLAAAGVACIGLAGVARPALWIAALLFGLPFDYGVKLPLLPLREFSLVEVGVYGGVIVLAGHWVWRRSLTISNYQLTINNLKLLIVNCQLLIVNSYPPTLLLALLTTWALVTVPDARYPLLALREWRTVFLSSFVFALLVGLTLHWTAQSARDRWLLVGGWLAGATLAALVGLWGLAAGGELVTAAEGVRRVQALYDSPNNLALYLERTLPVALALAFFLPSGRQKWFWLALGLPQALALVLTFSKGALFLAVPAMGVVLLAGGIWLLRREKRSVRPLLWLAGIGVVGVLLVAPVLGTERFQGLFDLSRGTGFLRLQLWQSAWAMAKDFPFVGVGPDNFLYHYRSDYILPAAWQEPNLNHPHNLILDWWTRLGVPGLVLGLAWMAAGVASIFRRLRHGTRPALALGLLAATAAGVAHGLIDLSYATPDLMLAWVLIFAEL